MQPDDETVIPQNYLYKFSWEADFEDEISDPRQDAVPDRTTQREDASPSDATDDDVPERNIVTDELPYSAEDENDVTERGEREARNNNYEKPSTAGIVQMWQIRLPTRKLI